MLVIAALPVLTGLALGIGTALEASGYVAAYGFGVAWILAICLVFVGLVMLLIAALRRAGYFLLASGPLLLLFFYASIAVAKILGLVKWL